MPNPLDFTRLLPKVLSRMRHTAFPPTLVGLLALIFLPHAFADEGMWLYNAPPREILKQKHRL